MNECVKKGRYIMNIRKDEYLLSDNKELIDIDAVYKMLSQSYWALDRTKETIKESIENSLCFGIYLGDKQIAFTRVVTDGATFSWICDVIVASAHRGIGLGKWMVSYVFEYDKIKHTRQLLATKDAHGLYEKFGFAPKECMFKKNT